jgi:hypothetical protein
MDPSTGATQLEGEPAPVSDSYSAMDTQVPETGLPAAESKDTLPQTPVTANGDGSAMHTDGASANGAGEGANHKSGHRERVIKVLSTLCLGSLIGPSYVADGLRGLTSFACRDSPWRHMGPSLL